MKRTYTLPEANRVLRLVQSIARELIERRNDRRALARKRDQLEAAETPEGLRQELAELDARIWEHDDGMRRCKNELEELGMTILRPNPLTVHIPGRNRLGRGTPQEVVFCWQEGEDAVCFGHPIGQEEHQRRPLRVAKGA
jgi:hypothetical protein